MASRKRPIPPLTRPDGNPPHDNPVRALREELRLNRHEFARLVSEVGGKRVSVGAIRTWEDGMVFPRPDHLDVLIEVAERNRFPLSHRAMRAHRKEIISGHQRPVDSG